jgi:O-antigen ligase
MRVVTNSRVRFGFLAVTLSLALAGDAWRYTLGWWVFGVLGVLAAAGAVVLLVVDRRDWRIGDLPYPLLVFLALATLSLAWSFYPAATALGLLTTWMLVTTGVAFAVSFPWSVLRRALSAVLKVILVASLAFELFVSVVIRHPILPLAPQINANPADYEKIPKLLYWSRNELFEVFDEGRIQGIVGNANHLGFLALLALIVFAIEWADRVGRRWRSIAWLVVATVVLLCSRSATVTVALVVTAGVVLVVLLLRRAPTPRARTITYAALAVAAALAVGAAVVFRSTLLDLLGKSADLTGRVGIWEKVIDLAQQRPAFGWGWTSYWVGWVPPFDDLAFRNGVRMLQAHNAWIDVWFQLGIAGLIVFGALVLSTLARSWSLAVDHAQRIPGEPLPYRALPILPLAILVALLVQSLAESRLLVEFGILLLTLIAVKTKLDQKVGGTT